MTDKSTSSTSFLIDVLRYTAPLFAVGVLAHLVMYALIWCFV